MSQVSSAGWFEPVLKFFDNDRRSMLLATAGDPDRVEWLRLTPFFLMHLGCLGVIWTGTSWFAVALCVVLYALRMFAITAFYHRLFSHRSYQAPRWVMFGGALLGNASAQRGPLWWAAHHRKHHRFSDTEDDAHSPVCNSFLYSHMLWFATRKHFPTDTSQIPDLMKYPELRWLDRYDAVVPLLLLLGLFGLGELLAATAPGLGTSGFQLVVWGFCISTTLLFHATATVNSLAHRMGRRRFQTKDDSRNSLLIALITFGEGWHNNHHYAPGCTRQGFRWWEIDMSYYGLKVMSWIGMVGRMNPVPERARSNAPNPS